MRITAVHESAIALLSRAFPAAGPELAKADIGAPKAHTTMKQGTKNNLTRQGVLRALRRNDELLQKHAVRRIALFGSYASGRQTRKSGLDFLVEFKRPTYNNFLGLSNDLEWLLGRKADILHGSPLGMRKWRHSPLVSSNSIAR